MNNVVIIVDIGVNHNSDLSIAKRMIRVAKKCNVNYIK